MASCSALGSNGHFPEGLDCSYFANSGNDGPHNCSTAPWVQFASWRVTRGMLGVFGTFDDHPSQPDNARCAHRLVGTSGNDLTWMGPGDCSAHPQAALQEGWIAKEGPPV